MLVNTAEYLSIIENIKIEITAAQYRAAVHVNADMERFCRFFFSSFA